LFIIEINNEFLEITRYVIEINLISIFGDIWSQGEHFKKSIHDTYLICCINVI